MKKKVVIHGADRAAQSLIMKINHIFDIVAMIDRNKKITIKEFEGIPHYVEVAKIEELEFDYILVTGVDYEGVQREYRIFHDIPERKIINMNVGHQEPKRRLFYCLANEIYRLSIPGAVAELGVDYGDTAKYINFFFHDRKTYLFDTFAGFPEEDIGHERNLNCLVASMAHHYDDRSSADDVLRRMYDPDMCEIKKGMFPDSLCGLEERFAFVHIDCDLSKPIIAGLDYFYPRLSLGGYICVHDYYNPLFPGVRGAVAQYCSTHGIQFIPNPYYGGVVICKNLNVS